MNNKKKIIACNQRKIPKKSVTKKSGVIFGAKVKKKKEVQFLGKQVSIFTLFIFTVWLIQS
jgi:hypothetical protein